ncbi:MAG: hypothetical protein R2862_10940 [Thermoanaerobaculia bacterium]
MVESNGEEEPLGPSMTPALGSCWSVLGLFIASDFALFSWLIFKSLSQRELDRVLLGDADRGAEPAGRIAGSAERAGGDLFTAVALEQETQTYIDSVMRQRQIVQTAGDHRQPRRPGDEGARETEIARPRRCRRRRIPRSTLGRPAGRDADDRTGTTRSR